MILRVVQFQSAYDFQTVTHVDYDENATPRQKRSLYRKLQKLGKVEEVRGKRPSVIADMEACL